MSNWSERVMRGIDYFFKYTRGILAIIIVVSSFAFLFCLLFVHVPHDNEGIINLSVGFVLASLGAVVSYYFATSKDKSDADQSKIFPQEPPKP